MAAEVGLIAKLKLIKKEIIKKTPKIIKLGALFNTGLGLGSIAGYGASKLVDTFDEKEAIGGYIFNKKAQWDIMSKMEEKLEVIEKKVDKTYLSTLDKLSKAEALLTSLSEKEE